MGREDSPRPGRMGRAGPAGAVGGDSLCPPNVLHCGMVRWLIYLLLAGAALRAAASDDYLRSIDSARATRVAALTAPDSWLSLVGLHPLKPGAQTVGSAADNAIVLATGPARLGTLTWQVETRRVAIELAPEAPATVGGATVRSAALDFSPEAPTVVRFGEASLIVIERGAQLYLRVRDNASKRRRDFAGIDTFPTDPVWRIEAEWVPFDPPQQVPITNVLGQTIPSPVPGKAVLMLGGHRLELIPIDEGGDELFFILTDQTAGAETYGAARFLYAPKPRDGRIVLDFNLLENPPCAFTPFATCPLPPKPNRIPLRVTAGERSYRGEH